MHPRHHPSSLAVAFLLLASSSFAAPSWTDRGTGFAAGELGDSGQNLYINRRGELETIRRYDLDGNGRLDLLFNSTHDLFNAVPATFATLRDGRVAATEFALDGSSRVAAVDLNRDGFTDLVFMPNRQNVQQQRSSLIIAWGDAAGWSTQRLTRQLPVEGVTSLAVGDLNGDGWPDLLTLNSNGWLFGQPSGKILRVYWNGPEGFLHTRHQDLGVTDAVEIATGAFGPKGEFPAAVVTTGGELRFLQHDSAAKALKLTAATSLKLPAGAKVQAVAVQPAATGRGDTLWFGTNSSTLVEVRTARAKPAVTPHNAAPASHVASGDLDGDGQPDLVLTNLALIYPNAKPATPPAPSVRVVWGTKQGPDFANAAALEIPNAQSATIGDLDGDGRNDLAIAVFQGTASLKASSVIIPGTGSRQLSASRLAVPTEGAEGAVIARVSATSQPTLVFANSQHRTLDDAVPLRLYWGLDRGFSREAFVDLPNLSGYKSSASDLNGDGHVDLIVINGGDISVEAAARAPETGINIYWGGTTGAIAGPGPTRFDHARRLILTEKHLGSINVADLNRDGYLDLVLGAFESSDSPDTQLILYFGGADGFSTARRQAIPVTGRSIGCLIADFNRDGHLDIVVGSYGTDQVITFWGHAGGYDAAHQSVLPYPAPIDIEAADFNGDGWLDLIVASYQDSVSQNHDMGSSIFWGGPAGWKQAQSQWLPGMTPLGLAVADLDGDGHLDLVSPHYHGELSRESLPCYIFWGSANGFAARNRTSLIVDSASEVVIGDFNGDGRPDLAFAAHSIDPGHLLESPVFYNDGNRFAKPKVQYLPAVGPHYMWVQDIGNIRNRRNEEYFTSRRFNWDSGQSGGRIDVTAATPHHSRVSVQVRSAASAAALEAAPWRETEQGAFQLAASDRALQYRLTLHSANGDAYPVVQQVTVSLK
jgi:hypothetical protein